MKELIGFVSYNAAAMGLTVLLAWPEDGLSARLRERLRRIAPAGFQKVFDCYVCLSPWCALVLSPLYWLVYRDLWCFSGVLVTPFLFWWLLRETSK
jgi:hypothetical protein